MDVTGVGIKDLVVTAIEVKGPGSNVTPPPGIVYEYADLSPAHYTEITEAKINFVVPQTWLNAHNFVPQDIILYHSTGKNWVALPTTPGASKDGMTTYTAVGSGFSRLAITGQFNRRGPVQEQAQDPTTNSPTPVPSRKKTSPIPTRTTIAPAPVPQPAASQGFPFMTVALIAAAGVVLAASGFLIRRLWIRRQNPALFREYR
jgi:hypothetical protein